MSSNKTYHHGDLKEALIQAARRILREQGADALSLRAIAADVGVSHMAPYAHFKNKKALFQTVAASGFAELSDRMEQEREKLGDAHPADLILSYGATYVQFAIENPQLYRLMLGQVETVGRRLKPSVEDSEKAPVANASELDSSSQRPFELLEAAFSRLSKDHGEVVARALGAWSMVHGMAALIIEGHFSIPEGETVRNYLAQMAVQTPR